MSSIHRLVFSGSNSLRMITKSDGNDGGIAVVITFTYQQR